MHNPCFHVQEMVEWFSEGCWLGGINGRAANEERVARSIKQCPVCLYRISMICFGKLPC